MVIKRVETDKWSYLPLLLIADESEEMIGHYLDRGDLYVMYDEAGEVCCVCAVADQGEGTLELKNIVVVEEQQKKGYGRAMIEYVAKTYAGRFHTLLVGTGDSPLTVPFYEKCGFQRSHSIPNFFIDNYDHPMYECGILLRDMVYFKRPLSMEKPEDAPKA